MKYHSFQLNRSKKFSNPFKFKKKEKKKENLLSKFTGKYLDKDGSLSNPIVNFQIRFLGGLVVKGSFLWILD